MKDALLNGLPYFFHRLEDDALGLDDFLAHGRLVNVKHLAEAVAREDRGILGH